MFPKRAPPQFISSRHQIGTLKSVQTKGSSHRPARRVRSKQERSTPILNLPTEIVVLVAGLLSLKNQLAFSRTNRHLYHIVNSVIYEDNVKHAGASSLFWGAVNGRLGTLKHALQAGADLDGIAPIKGKNPDAADGEATDVVVSPADTHPNTPLLPWATPLHLAAKNGHRDIVNWLLDNGVNINAPSFRVCDCQALKPGRHPLRRLAEWPRWRALHTALCHEERSVAELLIFRGASLQLDATPDHNHTALHSAAANGLVPVIKLLALDVNLNINERDASENTALHYVANLWAARDSAEIRDTITKLLALGADLEALNENGHTPLLNACYRGNYAVAHRLVSIGASPEPHSYIPNFRDFRPLYYCLLPRSEFFDLDDAPIKHDDFEGNRVSLIKTLIESGADVEARFNQRGFHSVTALMLACELAEPRAVAALIQGGAVVNAQDRHGRTPLFYACSVRVEHRGEVPEIATFLIRHGARIDLEEDPNNSPLDWAIKQVRWGDSIVLEVMLKAASKVNLTHPKLRAALRRCASSGNHKALKALLQFGDRTYGVTEEQVKEYMDLTIKQHDPWNQRDTFNTLMDFGRVIDSNEVLLLKTIMQKNRDLSLAVLERGVSVCDSRFYGGQTYLHLACQWGDIEVVKALLERAADVDVFDNELRTPLSIAVVENAKMVAELLMKEVADPHLVPPDDLLKTLYNEDADEWRFAKRRYLSAFELAIREDRVAILTNMLSHYELPEIPPGSRYTYLHRACENPNTEVLKLLLDKGADANGGKGCLNPPVPSVPDTGTGALQAAKLLFKHMAAPTAAMAILKEILLSASVAAI
ncbi:ankyrin repeat-containing domain protein [Lasiosphaeris hirsuta]|uniref:Ankyrin repeat-containing domain protein n=1 Tax=Lasiosphaeris hirsuta TaxID=260670 RepID=A0AA40BDB7_9PEZI|nr:ankyrin repeat-containing domain protein [Lasiosphaeris hirsuta]